MTEMIKPVEKKIVQTVVDQIKIFKDYVQTNIFKMPLKFPQDAQKYANAAVPARILTECRFNDMIGNIAYHLTEGIVMSDEINKNLFLLYRDKDKMLANNDFIRMNELIDNVEKGLVDVLEYANKPLICIGTRFSVPKE